MILSDLTSTLSNKLNKIYENTLNLTNVALENTSKEILSKINSTYQKTQESGSLLAGESSPFGTGYMGDIVVDDAFVFPENDIYNRCILQCKNFYLPAGVTLTIPNCAGFYILSQGNIIIDGIIKSQNNLVLPESSKESVNYFELNGTKYFFANGGTTRYYKESIKINESNFSSSVGSKPTTTWSAQTLSLGAETTIYPRHYGGYPASIYIKTLNSSHTQNCDDYNNKGITGIVLQDLNRKSGTYSPYNLTDTYEFINSKEIKSSASIILIAQTNININGTIEAVGIHSLNKTSTQFTYSALSNYLGSKGSYGSKSGYQVNMYPYVKYPVFTPFSLETPSASGGITLLSNSINIENSKLLNNGYKHVIDPITLSDISGSSITVTSTATSRNNTYKFTMSGKLGGITIPGDTIISTPGEIKIYNLGGI